MDYGEKQYTEDPRDNLNLENWTPEHDLKNIGNRAIFSNENAPLDEDSKDNVLGQIVDIDTTSALMSRPSGDGRVQDTTDSREQHSIVIGDHFDDRLITEINRAENELSQTGNISNFYDEIRNTANIASEKWVA